MNRFALIVLTILTTCLSPISAKDTKITSPDGKLVVTLSTGK